MKELLRQIGKYFNWFNEPFKIKVEVRRQESRHIYIGLYMTLDQSDELIQCIENSGEISNAVLSALSESIRNGDLETTEKRPFYVDMEYFKRWDDYFKSKDKL
jgi:hypothetical protein